MKTRLLFTFTLLLAGSLVFSQNLQLSYEGEPLEPNAQLSIEGPAADPEIIIYISVHNNGGTDLDVLCQRYELDMVTGAQSAICWGGLCFPPDVSLSPLSGTVPAGSSNDDFSGHYYPNSNPGVSTVAYTFFDQDNPDDSVMVTVMYDGLTVGIENPDASGQISIYPNPAADQVKVDVQNQNLNNHLHVQLTDSKGAIVLQETLHSGTTTLNTSQLSEGLYFMNAFSENEVIASKKVLIKR